MINNYKYGINTASIFSLSLFASALAASSSQACFRDTILVEEGGVVLPNS